MIVRLAILVLVVAVAITWWLMPNKTAALGPQALLEQVVNHSISVPCELSSSACKVRMGEFSFDLRLLSGQLKSLTPITIELSTQQPELAQADWSLWFQGRDMNMGVHWLQQQQPPSQAAIYSGMIPICTVDEAMTWQLIVQTQWQGEIYRSSFDFQVEH